jgi:hypothetical protein
LTSHHQILPRRPVAARALRHGSGIRLARFDAERRRLDKIADKLDRGAAEIVEHVAEHAVRAAWWASTGGDERQGLFRRRAHTPRARPICECLCKRAGALRDERTNPVHKRPSRSYLALRGDAGTRTSSQEKAEGDMPLRQDGSGGTRSARPPTSIPPQRTSPDAERQSGASQSIDQDLPYRCPGGLDSPARRATPEATIAVIEEVTPLNPFVASSRS